MKQSFIIFGLSALIATSCLKEKHDKVFSQEMLNGKWEAMERNSFDCVQQLRIADTSLSEIKICDGIKMEFNARNYSFNGQIVKYTLYGIDMAFQVYELTEQKLVLGDLEYNRIDN